jgi:hypothetical protein
VQVTLRADELWSFSRIGTPCFEIFFGFIRRQSFGDNRSVTATPIVARDVLVADVMHELGLGSAHHRRDNVSGVVISGSTPEFSEEFADKIFRSLLVLSSLELYPLDQHDLLSFREIADR